VVGLVERVDLRLVNKKVLESLVKAGAFDGLAPGGRETYLQWRPRVLAGLDRILDHGARRQRDRDQGQERLFGGEGSADPVDDASALPVVRAWTETEALACEKEALGLYMSGHPLRRYSGVLQAAGARPLGALTQSEADCAVAGVVTTIRHLKTKRGDRMAVFGFEDEAAKTEAVVFPEAFSRFGALIADDAMLLVRGKYERDEESSRLVVSELTPLEAVREKTVREVEITLAGRPGKDVLLMLAGVFERHAGDRRVSIVMELNGGAPVRVRAGTARRIRPSDAFVREVESVCGTGSVMLK
jgi:DNA polymerase-3 subunit alpha